MSGPIHTPPLSPVRGFVVDVIQVQLWCIDLPITWNEAIKQSYTFLEYTEPPYPNCAIELRNGNYYYCYCKFESHHTQKYLRARVRINEGWLRFQPIRTIRYHNLNCVEVKVYDRYLQQWL